MKGAGMNKYDYGFEIIEDTTIEWAYKNITYNSNVLEIGPANGNLVRHLHTDKKCIVDIVEIDQEAGIIASKYARNSCLGIDNGNLETDKWFNSLKNNKYDFIVILDVLEHVRFPEKVLSQLKELLDTNGLILLSIPNIAHNSVILNLMINKFEYTDVGLLDNTHVRFFTYSSVKEMLRKVELATVREQVKQLHVGENEVDVLYGVVPQSVEAYLKTRDLGTAYQFLFQIAKTDLNKEVNLEYKIDKNYEIIVFEEDSGRILERKKINPLENIIIEIAIKDVAQKLRIDPLNANCILNNVTIVGIDDNGFQNKINIVDFTGNRVNELLIFYDSDPQIYIKINDNISKIIFSCEYVSFDSQALSNMQEIRDKIREKDYGILQLQDYIKKLEQDIYNLAQLKESLSKENVCLSKEKGQYQEDVEILKQENVCLKEINKQYQEDLEIFKQENVRLSQENKQYQEDIEILKQELQTLKNSFWYKLRSKIRL